MRLLNKHHQAVHAGEATGGSEHPWSRDPYFFVGPPRMRSLKIKICLEVGWARVISSGSGMCYWAEECPWLTQMSRPTEPPTAFSHSCSRGEVLGCHTFKCWKLPCLRQLPCRCPVSSSHINTSTGPMTFHKHTMEKEKSRSIRLPLSHHVWMAPKMLPPCVENYHWCN